MGRLELVDDWFRVDIIGSKSSHAIQNQAGTGIGFERACYGLAELLVFFPCARLAISTAIVYAFTGGAFERRWFAASGALAGIR
mmetsp:Transcript_21943/g.40263  ORF Transcript_21943/g.40263 Transcript_21943/m.40263 type:complete len:84 (+) Transcript_21943:470-721(+)